MEDQLMVVEEMGLMQAQEMRWQTQEFTEKLDSQTDAIVKELKQASGRISGLSGDVQHLNRMVHAGFSELISVNVAAARESAVMTSKLIELSEKMVFALENPAQTRAREMLSKGVHAYANGWWDEAKLEFEQACEHFSYDPVGWYYRARLAFWHSGDVLVAHSLVDDAVRYAAPVNVPIEAQSLLLKSDIYSAVEEFDSAFDVASRSLERKQTVAGFLKAAKLAGVLDNSDAMIDNLKGLVAINPSFLTVLGEPWTEPVRGEVAQWIKKIMQENVQEAQQLTTELHALKGEVEAVSEYSLGHPLSFLKNVEAAAAMSLLEFETTALEFRQPLSAGMAEYRNEADRLKTLHLKGKTQALRAVDENLRNSILEKKDQIGQQIHNLESEISSMKTRALVIPDDMVNYTHRHRESMANMTKPDSGCGMLFMGILGGGALALATGFVIGLLAMFRVISDSPVWAGVVVVLGLIPIIGSIMSISSDNSSYSTRRRTEKRNFENRMDGLRKEKVFVESKIREAERTLAQLRSGRSDSEQRAEQDTSGKAKVEAGFVDQEFNFLEVLEAFPQRLIANEEKWNRFLYQPRHRAILKDTGL